MNLNEFTNWALSQGQVGNPVNPPTYVGQCVSLVQQYLDKVFGIPYQPRGDAKDWATNANVLSYFDKVSSIQTGDIVDYGADFGNGAGHIGFALGNGQILDQNGHKSLHVATGAVYNGYIAILRHKGGTPGGQVSNPVDILRIVAAEIEGYGLPDVYAGKYDKELLASWGDKPIEEFIRHGYGVTSSNDHRKYQLLDNIAELQKQAQYTPVTETLYHKK